MNYQQAIADAIRQITFQNVDAAITAAEAGSGFSFFCAAAVAAMAMVDAAADANQNSLASNHEGSCFTNPLNHA